MDPSLPSENGSALTRFGTRKGIRPMNNCHVTRCHTLIINGPHYTKAEVPIMAVVNAIQIQRLQRISGENQDAVWTNGIIRNVGT